MIAEAGGVKSHIEFEVMVTNDDNGSLFGTDTCTICIAPRTLLPTLYLIALVRWMEEAVWWLRLRRWLPYTEFTCGGIRQLS